MSAVTLSRLAAVLAALAIILGAMGAHGKIHEALVARGSLGTWETGVFYHLIHAVVLWALAGRNGGRAPAAAWLFLAGIALFSGSLYGLSLAKIPALGPVTPLGGLAYIAGWLWLAARPLHARM
jgi:uncharacterized membrane protein YgdD (TMEM256/DUF423 family)